MRSLWRDAVKRGEIPGGYWATLTHPAATRAMISDAFGEVHMLSHLVGAANRADIRRLCQLEEENAELHARLDKQQAAFGQAVATRDATIQELRRALAQQLAAGSSTPDEHTGDAAPTGRGPRAPACHRDTSQHRVGRAAVRREDYIVRRACDTREF